MRMGLAVGTGGSGNLCRGTQGAFRCRAHLCESDCIWGQTRVSTAEEGGKSLRAQPLAQTSHWLPKKVKVKRGSIMTVGTFIVLTVIPLYQ